MKDIMIMEIQKIDDQKNLRTLILSTDANDYDTGEPIIDGSISKTLVSNNKQNADNPILASLHGVVVGRKYCECAYQNQLYQYKWVKPWTEQ
jgi:hypothetical protein